MQCKHRRISELSPGVSSVGIPLCLILTEICNSVFLMITNVQNINPWNLLFLKRKKKLHIHGLALMRKLSHRWHWKRSCADFYQEEQRSSALGINAHHHGPKLSGASRSHVIIASAGEPNVKVHRKQFKLSLFTHLLAVVVLLFHLTLFHIIVITSIKLQKKTKAIQ